jgi:hypothetical protein
MIDVTISALPHHPAVAVIKSAHASEWLWSAALQGVLFSPAQEIVRPPPPCRAHPVDEAPSASEREDDA